MKICKYCGTEYDDSEKKCPNCGGTKIISARELAEEADRKQREIEEQKRIAAALAMRKKAMAGAVAAAAAVIAAVVCFSIYKVNRPLSNGMTKDEAQGVFDSGVAFMDAGQYENAIDTFLQLPSDSKKYAEAQELLVQSQDAYRTDIVGRVDARVESGDYDAAFGLIEKARTIIPGDAALQSAYDDTYAAYRTAVLAKTDEYSQSGQYKMAMEYLNGVQAVFSGDAQIQEAYDSVSLAYKNQVRAAAIADADSFVAGADYASAVNTLQSAIDEIGQDEEVAAKLSIVSGDYAASVIDAAKAQYIEYNADSIFAAEDMIGQALKVLPDNEALRGELAFYEDHEPIDLFYSPLLLKEWGMDRLETATDNRGNVYDDVLFVSYWGANAYSLDENNEAWLTCSNRINTDYQYSRITGVLFQNGQYASAATRTRFTVWTEEGYETLWAGEVTGDSEPQYFSADVSGKQEVRVLFKADYHKSNPDEAYNYAYIAQLYLWK